MKENDILHETANLHAVAVKTGIEIRLNGNTHSIAVGVKKDIEAAKITMGRLEKNIGNLRKMYQLPA